MTKSTTNDIKINYIDIGSRGLIVKPWSRKYIRHLLSVDPLSKNALPFCIFTDNKQRDFYILKKEQCSSLFHPDYKFIKKHFGVIKNKYRIKKQITVQCKRMDSILENEDIEYDFMKIDTQGADLQVIQSCGKFLNNLIGIHLEAFFIPFYKNISLFDEIVLYLSNHNFILYATLQKNDTFGDFFFINQNAIESNKKQFIINLYRKYN